MLYGTENHPDHFFLQNFVWSSLLKSMTFPINVMFVTMMNWDVYKVPDD